MATQGSGAELMELVTQMKGTIEQHFLPVMQEMQSKLDTESARVKDWTADVYHAAKEVPPALHEYFQAITQKLEETEHMAKDELAEAAQTLNGFASHMSEAHEHAQGLLNTALTHAHDVTEKLHTADDTHGAIGDHISHALGEWESHVTEHLGSLDTHHHTIVDALNALHDHATQHANELGAKLQQTGEFVTEHVGEAVQTHVANANELLSQQKDHLVHSVGEALGGHVGELIGHVQGFGQVTQTLHGAFDGGLGDVLEKVDEVGKLIDSIKPVIDLAKKLS